MDQLIVYGSQYGTTQRYAERFVGAGRSRPYFVGSI